MIGAVMTQVSCGAYAIAGIAWVLVAWSTVCGVAYRVMRLIAWVFAPE
jgi:hypothetical protein